MHLAVLVGELRARGHAVPGQHESVCSLSRQEKVFIIARRSYYRIERSSRKAWLFTEKQSMQSEQLREVE